MYAGNWTDVTTGATGSHSILGVQRARVELEPDLAIWVRLTEQGAHVRPDEESEITHVMCKVCTAQLQGTPVTCGDGWCLSFLLES